VPEGQRELHTAVCNRQTSTVAELVSALPKMEIRMANACCNNPEEDLSSMGFRSFELFGLQNPAKFL